MPNLTLMDWSKRQDPNGQKTATLVNLLSQTNAIIQDAVYVQGNLPTGHRVTVVTGLPTVYARAFNEGVATSKGSTAQFDEQCAMYEAFGEVDIDLAALNGNSAEFRLSEARLFIEAMNQKMATDTFYANPASDPKTFLGLAGRYSSLSAGNAQNIINGGGSTSNIQTSVWLLCWSENTVFNIFPKGSSSGLLHENLGIETSEDAGGAGKRLRVYRERFQWKTGLVVKDWRYAVRIANIEVGGGTDAIEQIKGKYAYNVVTNVIHLMAQAISRLPNTGMGKCVFYMNRTIFTALMRTALEKGAASGLTIANAATQFGTPQAMMTFLGIPIRQCDALLNTEAVVS